MSKSILKEIDYILNNENKLRRNKIDVDVVNLKSLKKLISNNEYSVSILGTMKSGKSTLINALLGTDLMPSENQACTLTNTEIIHSESENIVKKIYDDKSIDLIKGKNLSEKFLQDVRNSRQSNQNREFIYEINHNIKCLSDIHKKNKFKLVDTPGYNEMSGLGVDRETIHKIFKNQLKKTNFIVYVFDYKYYKSNENIEILNEIKAIRPDLIENNNICFVVNKVDLISYKDGSIESIEYDINEVLSTIGLGGKKIISLSSKKALLSNIIRDKDKLDLYKDEIDNFAPIIKTEINGKMYNVQMPYEELSDKLMEESNIVLLESILRELYKSSDVSIEKSYRNYLNNIRELYAEQTEKIVKEIINTNRELDKEKQQLEKIYDKVISTFSKINKNKKEVEKLIKIPTFEDAKNKEYISGKYSYTETVSVRTVVFAEYRSKYTAESEAKLAFRKWKNGINIDLNSIYSRYNDALKYSNNPGNTYYDFNKKITSYLSDSCEVLNDLISHIPKKIKLIGKFNIRVTPTPIMQLTYENSQEYIDDLDYDNSTFIDIDDYEKFEGSGWFGDKYRTYYGYDILDAMLEEEKDINSVLESISDEFFRDFYIKKYKDYMPKVKKQFKEELEKIEAELEAIIKEYNSKADKLNKNIEITKNKFDELNSLYNKLRINGNSYMIKSELLRIFI